MYPMLCTGQMNEDRELTTGFSNVNSLVAFTRTVSMAQRGDSLIGMDSKESSRRESRMSSLRQLLTSFSIKGSREVGGNWRES